MLAEALGAIGSIAGGLLGNKSAEKAAKQNIETQKEFAKNSLSWKAADAERAGISKVFAMGAPTASFTPSSVGGNFDFLGSAGQNIGRAMEAGQSNPQTAASRTGQAIQLEGMQLDNDIKRANLSSILRTQSQPGSPPGIPSPNTVDFIPGQGHDQGEVNVSTKIDTANRLDPSTTPGFTPEVMLTRTNSGGYSPALPPALQEAYESMGILPTMQWWARNLIRPMYSDDARPGELMKTLPKDYHLRYNPIFGEYTKHRNRPYHNPRSR